MFGFAIQAKAREMLDKLKIPTIYVSVTPDVVNRLGQHGRWHYLLVTDPGRLGLMLNAFTGGSWDEGPFELT